MFNGGVLKKFWGSKSETEESGRRKMEVGILRWKCDWKKVKVRVFKKEWKEGYGFFEGWRGGEE